MSNEDRPSLSTIPIELIYKIFVCLDAQTIVRHVRCVCKRLYTVVNTYDQYHFNFKSISKRDFLLLCNYIDHSKVASLTLSDDDQTPGQIEYYLSLFRIGQFTRLRSLTLLEIEDCYLSIILKGIKTIQLKSLTIRSERDFSERNTRPEDLGSIISLPTLLKLNIKIESFQISGMPWPIDCAIQHLQINCPRLNDYYHIVQHLPNLRTLVVEQLNEQINDGTMAKPEHLQSFGQLYSLTVKFGRIDMIILQIILSLTPSIEHLQLIRCLSLRGFISHLPQWEKFVRSELTVLTKMDLFLTSSSFDDDFAHLHTSSVTTPFLTPFWTEEKKWFVTSDYNTYTGTRILYTPSCFDLEFEYFHQPRKNPLIIDQLKKINLDLESTMHLATSTQGGLLNKQIYPNVDELRLIIGSQWPLGSLRFLSTLLDWSQLAKLSFEIGHSFSNFAELTMNMENILKSAINVHSLALSTSSRFIDYVLMYQNIEFIVKKNVKHLTVSVSTVDKMQLIIRQLKHLSSIKFEYPYYNNASEMHLLWLEREKGFYTYRLNSSSISLWFHYQL